MLPSVTQDQTWLAGPRPIMATAESCLQQSPWRGCFEARHHCGCHHAAIIAAARTTTADKTHWISSLEITRGCISGPVLPRPRPPLKPPRPPKLPPPPPRPPICPYPPAGHPSVPVSAAGYATHLAVTTGPCRHSSSVVGLQHILVIWCSSICDDVPVPAQLCCWLPGRHEPVHSTEEQATVHPGPRCPWATDSRAGWRLRVSHMELS